MFCLPADTETVRGRALLSTIKEVNLQNLTLSVYTSSCRESLLQQCARVDGELSAAPVEYAGSKNVFWAPLAMCSVSGNTESLQTNTASFHNTWLSKEDSVKIQPRGVKGHIAAARRFFFFLKVLKGRPESGDIA